MKLAYLILLLFALFYQTYGNSSREWTDQNGRKITAEIIKIENESIRVKRSDNKTFTIDIATLSDSDQAYIRSLQSKPDLKTNIASKSQLEKPIASLDYENLDKLTKKARKHGNLDGLGVAIIKNYEIHAIGTAGKGGYKQSNILSKNDPVVIASCSKSITATLAAILVSQGHIEWDSRLSDVFPELTESMNNRFARATLRQLLSHSGGAPERDRFWGSRELHEVNMLNGSPRAKRYELVRLVSPKTPEFTPGKEHIYSNAGFYIAAAMLEETMDQSWESMIEELVFAPLQMNNSSATSDIDTPVTMPAGGIETTLEDFAKFCTFHMDFSSKNVLGIKRTDFKELHQPIGDTDYALGFFVPTHSWAKGEVLTHGGLNREFSSVFWLAPSTGFGIFAYTPNTEQSTGKKLYDSMWFLIKETK